MEKNKDKKVDVELLVDSLQRRAAADCPATGVADGLREWYGRAWRRRVTRKTAACSVAAGVATVALALTLMPDMQYNYMEGVGTDSPQEVCANIQEVLGVV